MALAESSDYDRRIEGLARKLEDFASLITHKCGYGPVLPFVIFIHPRQENFSLEFNERLKCAQREKQGAYSKDDNIYLLFPATDSCNPIAMADTVLHLRQLGAANLHYHAFRDAGGKSMLALNITQLVQNSRPLDRLLDPEPPKSSLISRRRFLGALGSATMAAGGIVAYTGMKDMAENPPDYQDRTRDAQLSESEAKFTKGLYKTVGGAGLVYGGGVASYKGAQPEPVQEDEPKPPPRLKHVGFIETVAHQLRTPCQNLWNSEGRQRA